MHKLELIKPESMKLFPAPKIVQIDTHLVRAEDGRIFINARQFSRYCNAYTKEQALNSVVPIIRSSPLKQIVLKLFDTPPIEEGEDTLPLASNEVFTIGGNTFKSISKANEFLKVRTGKWSDEVKELHEWFTQKGIGEEYGEGLEVLPIGSPVTVYQNYGSSRKGSNTSKVYSRYYPSRASLLLDWYRKYIWWWYTEHDKGKVEWANIKNWLLYRGELIVDYELPARKYESLDGQIFDYISEAYENNNLLYKNYKQRLLSVARLLKESGLWSNLNFRQVARAVIYEDRIKAIYNKVKKDKQLIGITYRSKDLAYTHKVCEKVKNSGCLTTTEFEWLFTLVGHKIGDKE